MKYAYITIITNKHFAKLKKKTLQTNIAVNGLYDTKLCSLTQSGVIRIIHCYVGLKCFVSISLVFAYICISQGSVEAHLRWGRMYNNQIIANCLQSVPIKEF